MSSGSGASADLSPLSGLAPQLASALVSLSSDIALVIGDDGVITNVAVGDAGPAAQDWVGKAWAETVTGDTRRKIELLLQDVSSTGVARRREVNHPAPGAPDIPIAYTAVRLGAAGPVLAVGRDLRAVAAIQQRFVDAQQEMERGYWRLRQAQTQHRLLDQVARDAVLVVDAQSLEPLQSNRAAEALWAQAPLPNAVVELLVMARSTGRAAEVRTRLPSGQLIELSATPFRAPGAEHSLRLLMRARPAELEAAQADGDAVVVTDSAGRVLLANSAFGLLCVDGAPVPGRALVEVLGDPQRSVAALLAEVRREGIAEMGALVAGGSRGLMQLRVTAALIAEGDQECIGLTLRRVGGAGPVAVGPDISRLAGELGRLLERVGEFPLDELMRQAAAVAERHAVASALARCGDDLNAAAALLGIPDAALQERVQRLGLNPT